MLFWDYFRKKWRMQDLMVVNSLRTALFCCKLNLVDTDQFSCEYLVWVLCYCSQTDVLFPHWVSACTCPYPRRWECPTHCGSEARNVLRLDIFRWILMLWASGVAEPGPTRRAQARPSVAQNNYIHKLLLKCMHNCNRRGWLSSGLLANHPLQAPVRNFAGSLAGLE